ncbi:uncharacterized protein N7458_002885 [Penicillium daleae]|uniref:Sulfotransferase domain-containing protein n=1 Tax=Penicillium daleae TaxID=63821 RepID=A0AAD6G7L3_9EURO|nr:uncharacterized protein N7458_002885 [Penicillium daleae]KAJ5461333.1 hypothetical protein N7458_002885 [Penicillium daleae]
MPGDLEILSPDRLFIFSSPRTASNLFMRILARPDQPKVFLGDPADELVFLHPVVHLRDTGLMQKPYDDWTDNEKAELKDKFQHAFNKLHNHMETARAAGKVTVVKEHASFLSEPLGREKLINGNGACTGDLPWNVQLPEEYNSMPPNLAPNETVLPSEFLLTCFPTFLIRHPMLAFPSYYRAFNGVKERDTIQIEDIQSHLKWTMTFKWTRNLYDWYTDVWAKYGAALNRPKPVILEADDIMGTEVIVNYCKLVGLDPRKLKYTWEPVRASELAPLSKQMRRMKDTLHASTGILKEKISQDLTLEEEVSKWKAEFGESQASQLEEWVKAAMPDYEYLWGNRLTL